MSTELPAELLVELPTELLKVSSCGCFNTEVLTLLRLRFTAADEETAENEDWAALG